MNKNVFKNRNDGGKLNIISNCLWLGSIILLIVGIAIFGSMKGQVDGAHMNGSAIADLVILLISLVMIVSDFIIVIIQRIKNKKAEVEDEKQKTSDRKL